MFICNRCGHTFQEPKYVKNGGGDIGEDWPVCPTCGDDDYDEARECAMCGVVKRDVHMCCHINVCVDCMNELASRAKTALVKGLTVAEYKAFREYYGLDDKII